MKLPKLITVFKVKINYKSGISEVFECKKFTIKSDDSMTWEIYNAKKKKPIDITVNGVAGIESVWQVGYRKTVVWE